MLYELFVARRYLRSKRKARFISLNTYFSVGGVMIGVAALIIVLSVMNGFEEEVRERILGTDAHLNVIKFESKGISDYEKLTRDLEAEEKITGASPYIFWKGMAASQQRTDGIIIKGIDVNTIDKIADVSKNMLFGKLNLGMVPEEGGKEYPGIVLGRYLADMLRVRLEDELILMSPRGVSLTSLWATPKMGKFIVTGIFETGMYEYDATLAYISIPAAQDLFDMPGEVTGIGLKTTDIFGVNAIGEQVRKKLGYPFYTMSWIESHRSLFNWMTIEKWAMFVTLSLIVLVAAFNIVSTLIMLVMEKNGEIGILRSMGAKSGSIMVVFVIQGMIVGTIGTLLGSLVGFILCWVQKTYEVLSLPADIYFINALPIKMQPLDFLLIICCALVICFLATLYPSHRASRLDPVEVIRYFQG